jgi:3-methyladenine DNA glycosylase AlkC
MRAALGAGTVQARTLAEILVVDFGKLLRTIEPSAPRDVIEQLSACDHQGTHALGILDRMKLAGSTLHAIHGLQAIPTFQSHPSDTVRGFAAYALACEPAMPLAKRYAMVRTLANDKNPGVREWAWIALRPHVAADVPRALALSEQWAVSSGANIRRFAVEILRPRGVWCAHIQSLKDDPSPALAMLTCVRSDESKYVQDSVANWLNDASKTQPAWVRKVVASWKKDASPATLRICKRAMRTIEQAKTK